MKSMIIDFKVQEPGSFCTSMSDWISSKFQLTFASSAFNQVYCSSLAVMGCWKLKLVMWIALNTPG